MKLAHQHCTFLAKLNADPGKRYKKYSPPKNMDSNENP